VEKDWQDYELIKVVYDAKKGKVGFRTIKMVLEQDYFVVMNHKKIRRLMTAFNLVAKVRRANPYRKLAKAT
jgi:putative transposase